MSDFTEEDERILSYLETRVARGKRYFKARGIADSLGLSAKQVGVRLPKLAEEVDDIDIEKWGRTRSTTWRVTPE